MMSSPTPAHIIMSRRGARTVHGASITPARFAPGPWGGAPVREPGRCGEPGAGVRLRNATSAVVSGRSKRLAPGDLTRGPRGSNYICVVTCPSFFPETLMANGRHDG